MKSLCSFASLLLVVLCAAPGCGLKHLVCREKQHCPPPVQCFVCDDYCCKPPPCACIELMPTCDCYCPKPPPCSCMHLLFCCDDYCRKPLPCCPDPVVGCAK